MGANRGYFYTRLYGPHHLWGRVRKGSRELREQRGVKGSEGSEHGAKQTGSKKGVKGSESISILGFRVPTICGRKNFDDHI